MPRPYAASSACRKIPGPVVIRTAGPSQKKSVLLGRRVMPVDPDLVMMVQAPMSWNPNPVSATDVIARPIDVIRPVTDLDIHNDGICHGCHSCEHCQKYPNFPFHTCNSISD